jgi:uncharacterized protein (TIGR02757 family)
LHLNEFLRSAPQRARIQFDPVELPHRYSHPRDVEVSALLAASLAYGRADLFKPKLEGLLAQMGASPATFVMDLTAARARALLQGFVYRFNVGTDIAVLLMGAGAALHNYGSLEGLFAEQLKLHASLRDALGGFTRALRRIPRQRLRRALGRERGLDHLLPASLGAGAAKRLNMFLRWMIRGPDEVDFGIWKAMPPSALLIPLDVHISRISRRLGLTRRKDLSWRTAEEITASLRRINPEDPVRYDFALCHHGMSGACPPRLRVEHCRRCALRAACRTGRRMLSRHGLPAESHGLSMPSASGTR